MKQEIYRVLVFFGSICVTWLVLAGGAVLTILGIVERKRGKEVHWRIYFKVLLCLLFVAFYLSWRDLAIKLETRSDNPTQTLKFDVADVEGRQNLEKEGKRIEKLEAAPLDEPIRSVTARARITIKSDADAETRERFTNVGGFIALTTKIKKTAIATGDNALVRQLGNGVIEFTASFKNADLDDRLQNTTLRELLSSAEGIELFSPKLPVSPEVLEGYITFTINNTVLPFNVPPQSVRIKHIRITGQQIADGIKKVMPPSSPTQSKASSP